MKTKYLVGPDCPITRLPKTFPTQIDEDLILGLDLGIGSCGQAVLKVPEDQPIHLLGVRAFDTPETKEKDGIKLKNPARRSAKLLRRLTRRRSQRLKDAKKLFVQQGLLPADYEPANQTYAKLHETADPLQWRVEALSRKLSDWEWACSLLHILKKRGFKSARKSDLDPSGKEGGTLQATRQNHDSLAGFRTVAEMKQKDPRFAERKRNREGLYTGTVLRSDLAKEVETLFSSQRGFGNTCADENLQTAFLQIFHRQRGLPNPLDLLGDCPFEPMEKRTCRHTFSFELCRALQKLNSLVLVSGEGSPVRLPDFPGVDLESFAREFGKTQKISWKKLRAFFSIPAEVRFRDLPPAVPKEGETPAEALNRIENEDFVARSNSNAAATGSHLLRKVLGEDLWQAMVRDDPRSLDEAVFCIAFHENLEDSQGQPGIFGAMADRGVAEKVIAKAREDLLSPSPTLHRFKGSVSLSSKACRRLLPELLNGKNYSDACGAAGYEFRDQNHNLAAIKNPVVASVLRESMKQVVHLIHELGAIPGTICVEIGRDLGRSVEERNEMQSGLQDRTNRKNTNRANFAAELGCSPDRIKDEDLLRYELWLEQAGLCPYSGESLPPPAALLGDSVEVDHIVPRSRCHDNSFDNKVLVRTGANRDKGRRTPAEWLGAEHGTEDWRAFVARVGMMPSLRKRKRRNLTGAVAAGKELEMASRHLNDTRHISRLVGPYLADLFRIAGENLDDKGSKRRIFFQPGAMTALFRKAWGLENLKKDLGGRRLGDKHHALDALICACLGESQRQWAVRMSKKAGAAGRKFSDLIDALEEAYAAMERTGGQKNIPPSLRAPWGTRDEFRADIVAALERVTVSRKESRKGKGALHDDTFYRAVPGSDGETLLYSRKSVIGIVNGKPKALLTDLKALPGIKDIDLPVNAWMKGALSNWIARGCPIDDPPRGPRPSNPAEGEDPRGPVIRKVTMLSKAKAGRRLRHGHVIKGKMVRLDVFSKPNRTGGLKYYLVPVYSYHLSSPNPPMRAITAHKPEAEWDSVDATYTFHFSLWPNSVFEVVKKSSAKKPGGEHLVGYYRGVNRDNGKIEGRALNDSEEKIFFSPKEGAERFVKKYIDRLGRLHLVPSEKRTWRGAVCT
jgi:CRISPR-associated endonuclease Csn1